MRKFFFVYGLAVLGFLAVAEYRGWSLLSTNEDKASAQNQRSGHGGYGGHYAGTTHK